MGEFRCLFLCGFLFVFLFVCFFTKATASNHDMQSSGAASQA